MQYPKISIITPSFNDSHYLETTILSIVAQRYPNLEYIIIDGGSTDGSVDIIKKYADQITYWVSEADNGMYDAVQKGFEKSTGEIMGWINSDDSHHPGSLFMIAQIFSSFPTVNWILGTPNVIDERNRIIYASHRPEIDKLFFYRKKYIQSRKFIQQESTFWRRSLWQKAGGYVSMEYKYAGDFELWIRFFKHDKLFLVPPLLGSFRLSSSGQASMDHYGDYIIETHKILDSNPLSKRERRIVTSLAFLEKIEWKLSQFFRFFKSKFGLVHRSVFFLNVEFDHKSQSYKRING